MKKIFLTVFVLCCAFGLVLATETKAGTAQNVTGWIWGGTESPGSPENCLAFPSAPGCIDGDETGIGWISMNNTNCDTNNANGFTDVACGGNDTSTPTINYGVNIPLTSGPVTGKAWSSKNLGWISFDSSDVTGCPDNDVNGVCGARRDTENHLLGWARIISIPAAGANAGGWQGWISLSSTNCDSDDNGELDGGTCGGNNQEDGNASNDVPDYGITINSNGSLSGFAWSDELGWIDFKLADTTAFCPPSYSCQLVPSGLSCDDPANCNKTIKTQVRFCSDGCGQGSFSDFSGCGGCSDLEDDEDAAKVTCNNDACSTGTGLWKEVKPE